MLAQEKIDKIKAHYESEACYYDGIPKCIEELTLEEVQELRRLIKTGELVINEYIE